MRNCGQRNVSKHRDIKDSDERVTLNMNAILKISEEFDNLNKMKTTSSESKRKLGRSGKGLVTDLALKTKVRSKNTKSKGTPSEMSA